ncbi:MAG TPA: hypothetical protein VII01_08170 [Solirubrobacteraceae bacterium]|jgi:hypothetical protein
MSAMLVVPAGMVGHLRDGLQAELGSAGADIEQVTAKAGRERRPESYREPLERLDGARALLDVIGWSATDPPVEVQVDLREHRRALTTAFEVALLVAAQDLEEADAVDAERAKRGEAPKRDATAVCALVLRQFVSAVEAQIGRLGASAEEGVA